MQQIIDNINDYWLQRDQLKKDQTLFSKAQKEVNDVIELLDKGEIRVAEKINDNWHVNEWAKKAVLLSFRLNDNEIFDAGPMKWFDKVPLKTADWQHTDFQAAGFRNVPCSIARKGSFIGKNAVLMMSYVNIGAYIGENTMIDTWAAVGSCAQIGNNCHISGGAGIGGVLEPLQANPVIIEDNCFIGARSEIAEGVIVEEGAVISMGVFIGQSTKIVDRATGEVIYGRVPAYSVVVPGSYKENEHGVSLYCAVIIKKVDAKTRSKTAINELLRD